jgi:hypothetical protein
MSFSLAQTFFIDPAVVKHGTKINLTSVRPILQEEAIGNG